MWGTLEVMLYLLLFLIAAGCHPSASHKKAPPRAIYDQLAFAQACARACQDEAAFAEFKRDPYFNLLWENHSFEDGLTALYHIEEKYPHFLPLLERVRSCDALGHPRTFDYARFGVFSPTTLKNVEFAAHLQDQFGDLAGKTVAQIGAGAGSLCQLIKELFPVKEYILVDLPEQLALARKVLEAQGVTGMTYLTPEELSKTTQYDCVISDYSFSEFSKPVQKVLIDRLLMPSKAGYLRCHTFPKHFGVEPLLASELMRILQHKEQFESSELHGDRADYFLSWRMYTGLR